jgi:hypothetical protein
MPGTSSKEDSHAATCPAMYQNSAGLSSVIVCRPLWEEPVVPSAKLGMTVLV